MNLNEVTMSGSAYWALIRWCAQELARAELMNEIGDTLAVGFNRFGWGHNANRPIDAEIAGSLLKLMVEKDDYDMLATFQQLFNMIEGVSSVMKRADIPSIEAGLAKTDDASPVVKAATSHVTDIVLAMHSLPSSTEYTKLKTAVTAAEESGIEVITLVTEIVQRRQKVDSDLYDFCVKIATKLGLPARLT